MQKTGGSSLTVTLPKKWVEKNKLKDKSLIKMSSTAPHTLILQPTPLSKKAHKVILNIDGLTPERQLREIIANYLNGADDIVIQSPRLTPEVRTKVRDASNFLIGFEIIDESAEKIVLRNIFDLTKFSIPQSIEKMFQTTISMFSDALKALIVIDKPLAKDIINRDFEIDKMHLFIMRQRHALIQDKTTQDEAGITLNDLHYYEDVSTQLERIADHAVKIARAVETMERQAIRLPSSFTTAADKIILFLNKSYDMVRMLDKNLAHEMLDLDATFMTPYSKKTQVKDEEEMFVVHLIEDSLDRVRGYTMNIAEVTIDQAISTIPGR